MSNLQSMFGGGGGGAKMNVGAMQAQMERNMKTAKQRERMKQKMSDKASGESDPEMSEHEMNAAVAAANEAVASLLRSEGMSDEGIEKLVFSTGETYQKSRPSDAPGTASHGEPDNANASSGKKKKKKKKKGKGGK